MAQTFEHPMFSPHPPAKLYKRLTNDMTVRVENDKIVQIEFNCKTVKVANDGIITVQNNRYAHIGQFRWIEETKKEDTDEQPLDGLIVPNSYLTIKTNSLKEFGEGDVVFLPKDTPFAGLWIIDKGLSIDYIFTPKRVQTYQYLPLSSVGIK